MWTNPEEARSDFVLAAATALFGPLVLRLLFSAFRVLQRPVIGQAISVVAVFAFTGLVPLLLARYRGEGREAFGLDQPIGGMVRGLLLAVPPALAGILLLWGPSTTFGASPFLGTFAFLGPDPLVAALTALAYVVAVPGAVLLYTFLTVKARDAFRPTEVTQLEALRTFGMATAGAALLIGLLGSIATGAVVESVVEPIALVAVVLIADRVVDARATTTRAAVLAPAIVALLAGLEIFGGRFLATLRLGLLAAGMVLVAAVLVESRRYAWAVVPLFAAAILYPSGLAAFQPV